MSADAYELVRSTDPRVTASKPTFTAEVSGSSSSFVPYAANTLSTSQCGWQIATPSTQVVLQRDLTVTTTLVVNCVVTTGVQTVNAPIAVLGRDLAFNAFPFNAAVNTWNISLGSSATSSQNTSLPDLLRCCDTRASRRSRMAPCALPKYASWNDALGTLSGLGSYADVQDGDESALGAFVAYYVGPDNKPLRGYATTTYTGANGTVVTIDQTRGIPLASAASNAGPVNIYLAIETREPILCSPFSWSSDDARFSEGLFNIANVNIQAQMSSAAAVGLIQNCSASSGCALTAQTLQAITQSSVWAHYLTPSLQTPLPKICTIAMPQVVSFPQTVASTLAPGASATLTFNNVAVGSVPDVFLISVRPQASDAGVPSQATDFALAITGVPQMQFANQSGLMSGWPQWALWQESVAAGCKLDYLAWSGASTSGGALTPMAGSTLALRPGLSFALPVGVSQGTSGQYQLSFQLQVLNQTAWTITNPVITLTTISSAFFVASETSSSIVNVALTESDVLKAPHGMPRYNASRLIGGGFWSSLGSHAFKAAKFLLPHAANAAADGHLGEHAQAVAKMVRGGAPGVSGAGLSGAGMHRLNAKGRGSIAERLAMLGSS